MVYLAVAQSSYDIPLNPLEPPPQPYTFLSFNQYSILWIFKICFNLLKFNIQFIRTQKMKENYTGLLRWTAVDGCFKLTSTHLQFGASNETLSKFAWIRLEGAVYQLHPAGDPWEKDWKGPTWAENKQMPYLMQKQCAPRGQWLLMV